MKTSEKTQNTKTDLVAEIKLESDLNTRMNSNSSTSVSTMAYDEMSDFPVQIIDPVEQIEKNLDHLQELQAKMKFMMKEVRYLLKV